MNVELWTEAAQIPEKEYINRTFVAVWTNLMGPLVNTLLWASARDYILFELVYYTHLVFQIDGVRKVEDVFADVCKALDA
jgi:hypothetical protein